MSERALARVVTIDELVAIEGADRIELAIVGGWQVVVQKGLYEPNKTLAVYFEVDSLLDSERPYFNDTANWSSKLLHSVDGRTHARVKTMKLRKQLSQGYMIPLSETGITAKVGDNLTKDLGVVKYEKAEEASMNNSGGSSGVRSGTSALGFPKFIPKTDQTRVQNITHMYNKAVEEGEELITLAKEKNKLLSVYQNRRYDSDYKAVKKVVDEKLLGDLIEAEFHYDRYTEQLSYKVHKETPTPGVGIVYDLGSHLIDQALTLFGMPHSVFADIDTLRPSSKVDDYMEILMFYNHFRVRIHSSLLVREQLPAYILHGKKGSFIKAKTDVQEVALQEGKVPNAADWGQEPENEKGLLHTEKDGKIIKEYIPSSQGNYMEYYDGIYKALRLQQPLPVTAEEGLNVIRIITAAHKSNIQKTVIKM